MTNRTRSVLIAILGMSAAWLATTLVSWHTLPKACLAGAVAGTVVTVLMFTLPRNKEGKTKPSVDIG
jgi:uncharacterized membrane protein